VNHLVQAKPIGVLDRRQWAVGRIPEVDHNGALAILGESEQLPSSRLIADRGVPGADPEAGGGEHHLHARLPDVEIGAAALTGVVIGQRPLGELADVVTAGDRVPGLRGDRSPTTCRT
jgi:hypothetical protein